MKKNHTVLVLLVAWAFLSISSLSSLAFAGEVQGVQDPPEHEIIVPLSGPGEGDGEGDPGDAGDGFGSPGILDNGQGLGGSDAVDEKVIDEFMLILMSLVKLAL